MLADIYRFRSRLFSSGTEITTKSWQGKGNPPKMLEILHVSEIMPMYETIEGIVEATNAKMPWAEVHFQERVSGVPMNPPPSHTMWAKGTEDFFEDGDKFSHSYPERMWSKELHSGIRYDIADLSTLVKVFFPEDLSASLQGDRVPCTLGWHFIVREGRMDCFYPMRSCDAVRHLHNDLFFANRLVIWLLEQTGIKAVPGVLHFAATSLHCFKEDKLLWDKGIIK